MIKLQVLYPHPTDAEQFEKDYAEHVALLHEKTGIPSDARPYTVTKFIGGPAGKADYYQMFSMPFESMDALTGALASEGFQEVAADANRISTGGPIVILFGDEQ